MAAAVAARAGRRGGWHCGSVCWGSGCVVEAGACTLVVEVPARFTAGSPRPSMLIMVSAKASFVLSLVVLSGCNDDKGAEDGGYEAYCESCNLDDQLPLLTADGATDCGSVGVGEDPASVASCIEQALADGTPFTARQQLMGIDSSVEIGYVMDDAGVVQQVSYDSNICGGATCEGGCGPRVSMAECGNPRVGAMPEQAIVDCDLGAYVTVCEPPSE